MRWNLVFRCFRNRGLRHNEGSPSQNPRAPGPRALGGLLNPINLKPLPDTLIGSPWPAKVQGWVSVSLKIKTRTLLVPLNMGYMVPYSGYLRKNSRVEGWSRDFEVFADSSWAPAQVHSSTPYEPRVCKSTV